MTWQLVSIEIDDSSNRSAEDDDEEVGGIGAGRSKIARIAPEIDWGRSARFTLVGAGFVAPVLHTWFGFLTRRFPGTAASSVVKRVALDQLVFAPVFLASFLSVIMLLDGNAAKVTFYLNRFFYPFRSLSSLGIYRSAPCGLRSSSEIFVFFLSCIRVCSDRLLTGWRCLRFQLLPPLVRRRALRGN